MIACATAVHDDEGQDHGSCYFKSTIKVNSTKKETKSEYPNNEED